MNPRALLVVAALGVACALPATASAQVRITFAGGKVTINASNATVAEILQEWSRVGGSRFVNIEKLTSSDRVTLAIEAEPEDRAIATLLRNAAGYVLAEHATPASASRVRSVHILAAPRAAMVASDFQQQVPSAPQAPDNTAYTVPTFPNLPRPDDDGPVRREVPPPPPANAAGSGLTNPGMPGAAQTPNQTPGSPGTKTLPGLGIVTSSQPGVVINSPATARPSRPTVTPTRPGGGGRR